MAKVVPVPLLSLFTGLELETMVRFLLCQQFYMTMCLSEIFKILWIALFLFNNDNISGIDVHVICYFAL